VKKLDVELGMTRVISRRDLLQGMAGLGTAALIPGCTTNPSIDAQRGNNAAIPGYPPALTGLRGNHKGSFEVGHQLGRQGRKNWGVTQAADSVLYDLVIVGGGISGLAAAHFHQKQNPSANILILDNHDDFGGHAKRNEFQVGGRTIIGYGGSQTLQAPSEYSPVVKGLLDDLDIDVNVFDEAYDQDFYRRNGLRAGIHFNREKWGVDRVVPFDWGAFRGYLPLATSSWSAQQAVSQMPISEPAKVELLRLLLNDQDQIPEVSAENKSSYLNTISYRDFLSKKLNIRAPDVFALLQDLAMDSGLGIEATTARFAINYAGLPGRRSAGLPDSPETYDYIHHFPDGNASIARALVQRLIPSIATCATMADRVTHRFDYSCLDDKNSPVRVRLKSTVIRVEHDGDPRTANRVQISYVNAGRTFKVQARGCILACYNAMIPYLCPELPATQREALAMQVKTPILYTNVVLRNWQAWKKLGIGAVISPGSYHVNAALDFPVSLGEYRYAHDPDEPVIVHMERFPHRPDKGLNARQQFRFGRHELLSTSFETIERNIRQQLVSTLGAGGFDPARDIEGITVNRWAHGYASWYSPLFDTMYKDYDYNDERYPHVRGRKRFGRITIANSDAAADAMFEAAVEEGYRAVTELA
jgi:spermidine dehydrogenase